MDGIIVYLTYGLLRFSLRFVAISFGYEEETFLKKGLTEPYLLCIAKPKSEEGIIIVPSVFLEQVEGAELKSLHTLKCCAELSWVYRWTKEEYPWNKKNSNCLEFRSYQQYIMCAAG